MAVRKFQQTPSTDLSAFYEFLNKYKEGTFLENVSLTLTQSDEGTKNGKIVFSDGKAEFFISGCTSDIPVQFIGYTGEYVTSSMNSYEGANKFSVNIESALLCSKGLIISVTARGYSNKQTCRIVLTVDNADKLALIIPNASMYSYDPEKDVYAVTTYDSAKITLIRVMPEYGTNKTSLAPIAPLAISTDRYLPYTYAALTTQLTAEGLQTVLIDGAPFITNGIWYVKDPE